MNSSLEKAGAQFIHKCRPNFHKSLPKGLDRVRKPEHQKFPSQKPADKINHFHKAIAQTHFGLDENSDRFNKLRNFYHNKHVIKKENIPESYYDNQRRLAIEQGHGDIEITNEVREQSAFVLISDQKSSLDTWLKYLTSSDTDMHPIWAKHWAFDGMLKLGTFDKERQTFAKRTKDTVAPFADLDREALAYVIDLMIKKAKLDSRPDLSKEDRLIELSEQIPNLKLWIGLNEYIEKQRQGEPCSTLEMYPNIIQQIKELSKEQVLDKDSGEKRDQNKGEIKERLLAVNKELRESKKLWDLIQTSDFGQLYAYSLYKVGANKLDNLSNIEGKWIRYPQGSDHMVLVEALQGYGTGWCTASEETAKNQLEAGDFYIYFSNNEEGEAKIPRAAIRMEGKSIVEVRGIGADQNLDEYISPVVDEKLNEFPGNKYKKKASEMKKLTEISKKVKLGADLNLDELRFLYELDSPIEGFGYKKDPRILEIRNLRNHKQDLSRVLGMDEDQIALGISDFNERTALIYGDLTPPAGVKIPAGVTQIHGNVTLFDEAELPQGITHIYGNLKVSSLSGSQPLPLTLTHVCGDLDLRVSHMKALPNNLVYVGGDLHCSNDIDFRSSALEYVGGSLDLYIHENKYLPPNLSHVGGFLSLSSSNIRVIPKSLAYVGSDLSVSNTKIKLLPSSLKHVGGKINISGSRIKSIPAHLNRE